MKKAANSLSQTCKPVMVALGLTMAGVGEMDAQQEYKYITQETNQTIVDLFHVDHTRPCLSTTYGHSPIVGVRNGTT